MIYDKENAKIHNVDNICVTKDQFINFYLARNYNENMFNIDGSINFNYNSQKKACIISKIAEDWWDKFSIQNFDMLKKFRPNAFEEFQKIIDCMNKDLGCNAYSCPNCGELCFIGNTCKSRLCTSCGYKYKNARVEQILQHAIDCDHRQIVFTIDDLLRPYFYDFKYMDLLFEAVNLTIDSIVHKSFKRNKNGELISYDINENFKAGFFAFLHTFGRDMKWNPHIHVLIAEKMFNQLTGSSKKLYYFNYDALSKRFQKILLDLLLKHGVISKSLVKRIYNEHRNGFYVYAEKKQFKSIKEGIEYMARYCGRPCISENRIINYDGTNVTFCYNAHEDDSYHEVTITALEFIALLVRHLIPYHFKTIRYYGFYRKKLPFHDKIRKVVKEEIKKLRNQLLSHRLSVLSSFNRDPYDCPKCGTKLDFLCIITEGG
mgnify:CR=1 FL=1